MPDLRPSQDPVPPAPAVAEQAVPTAPSAAEAPLPSENASLEERMLVESAPTDPGVANAYANAEEGGLTGLVLRLYQEDAE